MPFNSLIWMCLGVGLRVFLIGIYKTCICLFMFFLKFEIFYPLLFEISIVPLYISLLILGHHNAYIGPLVSVPKVPWTLFNIFLHSFLNHFHSLDTVISNDLYSSLLIVSSVYSSWQLHTCNKFFNLCIAFFHFSVSPCF